MNEKKYRRFLCMIFFLYILFFFIYVYTYDFSMETVSSNVYAKEEKKIMPLGIPVGIYIRMQGIMIVETTSVSNSEGELLEPAKGILEKGDYLLEFNGEKIESTEWFLQTLKEWKGGSIEFVLCRDGEEKKVHIEPVKTESGAYKIGIWIRQDAQGIGTLSYVDESGRFAALGHGIVDLDTEQILCIKYGNIYDSHIYDVVKGSKGKPGEMVGMINYAQTHHLGHIHENNSKGVYGEFLSNKNIYNEEKAFPTATSDEVKKGEAILQCCFNDEMQQFRIEIERIEYGRIKKNRDFIIHIVDPELLKQTNGIIQGMSGSPIIQDGKIIGAVTHVFVNDPTRGYGIFIEEMLGE